ncbi:MAG: DUF3617 family protein [Gammaproteobacteria bacterium]|nr:DUF3617 family protein [Gammaproteobacteria bacterium]NVK88110.1 DUF3617 family protein [Gammaproteobacteria bacterium]
MTMPTLKSVKLIALTALTLSGAVMAAELPIKPGMWETTTTTSGMAALMGKDGTETTQECVKERSINTKEFMQNADDCKVTQDKVSGNTLSFAMECTTRGIATTAKGEVTSDGDTGKGKMEMTMNMGGQKQSFSMSWTAKRVGDC